MICPNKRRNRLPSIQLWTVASAMVMCSAMAIMHTNCSYAQKGRGFLANFCARGAEWEGWEQICWWALAVNSILQAYCWMLCVSLRAVTYHTEDNGQVTAVSSLSNTVVCGCVDIARLAWMWYETANGGERDSADFLDGIFWILFWFFTLLGLILPNLYFIDYPGN